MGQNDSNQDIIMLVSEIKSHLNVVNAALIQPEDYSADSYDELADLYNYIKKKQGKLTLMEIDGVLEELKCLRQTK